MKSKMSWIAALGCALSVSLTGCGGSSGGSGGGGSYPNVNGNYEFTANSQSFPGQTAYIGGGLTSDGAGHISGTVHVDTLSSCYALTDNVGVSGTVNKAGQLSLTSVSLRGQVISVTGSVSQDGTAIPGAGYTIVGGCADGDRGSVNGFLVQSFTGNYTGTLTVGSAVILNGTLTQAATADSNGLFAVTGSLNVPNGTCFTAATVNSDSSAAGTLLLLDLTGNDGSQITYVGIASDGTAKNITGSYSAAGGNCSGSSGMITLTRP